MLPKTKRLVLRLNADQWLIISSLHTPHTTIHHARSCRLQLQLGNQPQHDFSSQVDPQFNSQPDELRTRRTTAELFSPSKTRELEVAISG
jgi:hypothetical protein